MGNSATLFAQLRSAGLVAQFSRISFMSTLRLAVAAALMSAAQIVAAFFYILHYEGSLNTATLVFGTFGPMPPLVAAWFGPRLALTDTAEATFATATFAACLVYALAFLAVITSSEPLAPLLLIIAAICVGLWLLGLFVVLWVLKRQNVRDA
jgi:hypothetical protein